MDSATLWERSLAADLGGIQARVLGHEDCVQHLCLHIGPHHHYLSRLQELLDFRFYLERHGAGIDWQALSERSLQLGSSAWVYLTLLLAQELLGAPVPATFFQSCPAPKRLNEVSAIATQHLLARSDLPMASSLVKALAGVSLKQRLHALAEHWSALGPHFHERPGQQETPGLGVGGYVSLFLRRLRFFARPGVFTPSAWSAAAKLQSSTAYLLRLMNNKTGSPLPR